MCLGFGGGGGMMTGAAAWIELALGAALATTWTSCSRDRKVISKLSCCAISSVQSGEPKGEPRVTLLRSAVSSASVCGS